MKRALHYLRIGWTVTLIALCMMVIWLWVRSYRTHDWLGLPGPGQNEVFMLRGMIRFQHLPGKPLPVQHRWQHRAESARGLSDLIDFPMVRLLGSRNLSKFYGPYFGFIYQARSLDAYCIYARMPALTILFAILALVPWLPWKLWLMRFSLRVLLLFMTLIALLLGWIMCFAKI
jgi:hypothetical protein